MRTIKEQTMLTTVICLASWLAVSTPAFGQGGAGTNITFPQIAAGPAQVRQFSGNFSTSLLLINPGEVTANINVVFTTPAGQSLSLQVNKQVGSSMPSQVAANGVLELNVQNSQSLAVGVARVNSDQPLQAQILYRFTLDDGTVRSEAGIQTPVLTSRFSTYVDTRNDFNTGVAVANTGTLPVNVEFRLLNPEGVQVGETVSVRLPPFQQIAKEVTADDFVAAPPDFVGTLRGTVAGGIQVAVTAVRYDRALEVLSSLPVLSQ